MEAVEDPVGGNNHALAMKIAAEHHPGMQPYTNTRRKRKIILPAVHPYNDNAGNYLLTKAGYDYSYSLNKTKCLIMVASP